MEGNSKVLGSEGNYWIISDIDQDGQADQETHCWGARWETGPWPWSDRYSAVYRQTDIRIDGKWFPAQEGWSNSSPIPHIRVEKKEYRFTDGKWQPVKKPGEKK